MTKKQRLQVAIDALILLAENDDLIADIVRELQEHHQTLPDENTEQDSGDGGNHPKDPPPIP